MIFERSSFWAGLLTASLPISVVAKSLVGSMLSIVVLGESMKHTHTFVLVAGILLVIIATVAWPMARVHLYRGRLQRNSPEKRWGIVFGG